jgi:hypothetical protein
MEDQSASNPIKSDPLGSLKFKPIDPSNLNVLLYKPSLETDTQTSSSQYPGSPKVIILATWLGGASASRIAVYCRGYQAAYPAASILLLRTVLADITVKSSAVVQAQLKPAHNFLLSAFPPNRSQTHDKAVLHMFSHGGCNIALQLSRLLRGNVSNATFPIPLIGVILDSCPGTSSFVKAYTGAVYSLPESRIIGANLLGRACLVPVVGAISMLQSCGILTSVEDLRRELNDLNSFGAVPRLYLHSEGDRLVAAKDVASHAAEIGTVLPVSREMWQTAEHAALPLEDAQRYWTAIRRFVAGLRHAREAKI